MVHIEGMQPPESWGDERPLLGILEGDRLFEHVGQGYFQSLQ
jgi:hypothetical protein